MDLDDSYPSDEEDNDNDYDIDSLDDLDEEGQQQQQPEMFIEVTEDQFRRTVGNDGRRDGKDTSWRRMTRKGEKKKKKKRNKTEDKAKKSVSRKLGHILTPLTKKISQNLARESSNHKNDDEDVQRGLTPLLMNSPDRSSALPKKPPSPSRVNQTGGNRIRFRDDNADGNNGNNNNDSSIAAIPDNSSVSDVASAFGQQSVANKTVNSFASTIKVSNRQVPSDEGQDDDGDDGDNDKSRNKASSRMTVDLRAAAVSGSRKIKKTKAWKKLTSIVKSGGATNNNNTANRDNGTDDGGDLSDGFSVEESHDASATKELYSMRRRSQSEDNNVIRKNRADDSESSHRNSIIGWGVKSISWEPGIWKNRTAESSNREDSMGKNNSSKRRGRSSKQKQMEEQRLVRSEQDMTDRAIRGRLDGVDVLSLGPACRSSLPTLKTNDNQKSPSTRVSTLTPNLLRRESDHDPVDGKATGNSHQNPKLTLDPLTVLFTDIPTAVEPSDLVSDMVCMSGGREHTEIVLEGFFPGGSDRWTVRLDNVSSSRSTGSSSNRSHPTLKTTSMTDDESTAISVESSTNIPSNQLWDQLWGGEASPPPTPYHMKGKDDVFVWRSHTDSIDEEELQQKFAADCNVPVDLDNDAFIVESPEQMHAVHQVISLPIQARRFETSVGLFQKLLRGLEGSEEMTDKKQWMIGATYHNIGLMHLAQAHFSDALHNFQKASTTRKECLPSNHPDIAVSLGRLGMVYFALNRITEARESFEEALCICRVEDATRAKILCNLGAAHYQLEEYGKAILVFTRALEIQRQWLDGPVRRETLVYDASVTLSNLGKCYQRKGDCDLAYFVYEEAWLLQTSHFRQDHDIVLASQDNMARIQATNGNYAEALRIFSGLAKAEEARFGTTSELYIETIGMKGLAHYRLLELEEAESCLMEVSSWQSKRLWWSHPSIDNTKELLKQVNRCLKGDDPMWL